MRFFQLWSLQQVALYIFPTLIGILLLGTALGFSHFRTKNSEKRQKEILYRFPDNTSDRNAPFPLFMTLVIIGTLVWVVGYILAIGFLEVKI
jgi:hypothetical protein